MNKWPRSWRLIHVKSSSGSDWLLSDLLQYQLTRATQYVVSPLPETIKEPSWENSIQLMLPVWPTRSRYWKNWDWSRQTALLPSLLLDGVGRLLRRFFYKIFRWLQRFFANFNSLRILWITIFIHLNFNGNLEFG